MEIDLGPQAAESSATSCASGSPRTGPTTSTTASTRGVLMFEGGPAVTAWTRKLHEAGYLCVAWPKEFGGRGLSGVEVAVLNEEFARARVPRVTRGMGEWLVGPSIIVHGTDEQKAHFLPRIIDGTDRYCQGFSEPDAGSDLAGSRPRRRRRRRGRDHRPEGVDLGRADREHDVLPVPHRPGRAQAPRHLLRAHADEAARRSVERLRAAPDPPDHRHERLHRDVHHRGARAAVQRHRRAAQRVARDDDDARQRARRQRDDAARAVPEAVLELVDEVRRPERKTIRSCARSWRGRTPAPRSCATRACARSRKSSPGRSRGRARRSTRCSGPSTRATWRVGHEHAGRAIDDPARRRDYALDRWQSDFLTSRSGTIWGGTAQVQRNIVGERVLGLPKEPRMEQ